MRCSFLLAVILSCCISAASAQSKQAAQTEPIEKVDSLPYQKYPTLPAFNILLTDSTTIFNTFNIPEGKPTAIILFDPGCHHCQAVIKRLTEGMDSLKDIRFYIISSVHNMSDIKKFVKDYHLEDYKNIEAIGRDYEYFFLGYYGVRYVPDIALYDGHKKLIKLMESHTTVEELYNLTHPQQ